MKMRKLLQVQSDIPDEDLPQDQGGVVEVPGSPAEEESFQGPEESPGGSSEEETQTRSSRLSEGTNRLKKGTAVVHQERSSTARKQEQVWTRGLRRSAATHVRGGHGGGPRFSGTTGWMVPPWL